MNIYNSLNSETDDREYWVNLLYKIVAPILRPMSENKLKRDVRIEYSPTWDGRSKNVAYMEAFGRTMAGVAPWLNLEDDSSKEGVLRKQVREWAMLSYANAVNPDAPDYLEWTGEPQALVDAAYIANSFLRAPSLWTSLDKITQKRYINEFEGLRRIKPFYSNWLLFRVMIETFLLSIDEEYDGEVMIQILSEVNKWYVGDGWYSDGPSFALDYYNSFVIHPMIVEITELCHQRALEIPIGFDLALRRMQRHNEYLERLISPEGTFPTFGRSITYRMGAFQSLALSAWKYSLPNTLTNGQVRNALTTVMKRMFANENNFTEQGLLNLGFVGYQPSIADYYTNTGSLYITTLAFLPLGLAPDHDFWTADSEDWTSRRAWNSEPFLKDYKQEIKQ